MPRSGEEEAGCAPRIRRGGGRPRPDPSRRRPVTPGSGDGDVLRTLLLRAARRTTMRLDLASELGTGSAAGSGTGSPVGSWIFFLFFID